VDLWQMPLEDAGAAGADAGKGGKYLLLSFPSEFLELASKPRLPVVDEVAERGNPAS
jgi:hypothetical protein